MTHIKIASAASRIWWGASVLSLLAVIGVLLFIFFFVVAQGVPAFRPELFTTVTNGVAGGLANAISGTLLLVVLGVALVGIVGFGTAAWTVEFASPQQRTAIRFCVDVLAGVPSIVVGYFLYVALVEDLGWGFSLIAGAFALAIIMLPYVVRAADLALSAVPRELREAAVALGSREATAFFKVALPWAAPGVLTGLLLATGIGLGETAPLIYTAGWSNYMPSLALTHSPVGYLTYVVWTFISQPFAQSHQLAYAAAALLMLFIFITNLVSRTALEAWGAQRHR
ncbi:MAG TPA: phosphate ABC transporter permease PstA [Candidatus Baltobacteraceae bacterium]|nr:phosphate ABC transporter permease PstA [Candidatus Baltobacteraceae bacterium]